MFDPIKMSEQAQMLRGDPMAFGQQFGSLNPKRQAEPEGLGKIWARLSDPVGLAKESFESPQKHLQHVADPISFLTGESTTDKLRGLLGRIF